MRIKIKGTVVDTDRNDWAFNGRSGVAYSVLLQVEGERPGSAATKVRVSAEQFGYFESQKGKTVELPVSVFANTVERQGIITGAKLSVTLDDQYQPAAARPVHAAS